MLTPTQIAAGPVLAETSPPRLEGPSRSDHSYCRPCGDWLPKDQFYTLKSGKSSWCCKPHSRQASLTHNRQNREHNIALRRRWQDVNREYVRWYRRLRKYGITPEDYQAMLAEQGGGCAICGAPPDESDRLRMPVDHCHETGKVRGILCNTCNIGLGMFKDNTKTMASAIAYVEKRRVEC